MIHKRQARRQYSLNYNSYSDNRKAYVTQDIFAHNIAKKRYCNKKIFLGHGWEAKVSSYKNLIQGTQGF